MLVAFEGIDGSGKSTLVRRVAATLRRHGRRVLVTAEPTRTPLGRLVRRGLRDRYDPLVQAGLFLADRALHAAQLAPELAKSRLVLTDRYADSTTAYQAAALDGRIPRALEGLRLLQALLFPAPDLVVLLDLEPAAALRRIRGRRTREPYERAAFLRRVRANYSRLAAREPARWLVLDAGQAPTALARQVVAAIDSRARAPRGRRKANNGR